MPGPTTEAVNDDVKELRGELHRAELALTKSIADVEAGLRGEIARVELSLTESIAGVANSLAGLKGEFAAFRWMLGLTLGLLISGIAAAIWSSGSTSAKLDAMDARIGRIEAAVARIVEHQEKGPRPEAPR